VLSKDERERLTENIAGHMKDAQEFIQKRAVGNFAKADPEYGRMIQEKLDMHKKKSQVCEILLVKLKVIVFIFEKPPSLIALGKK
jgi:catalase